MSAKSRFSSWKLWFFFGALLCLGAVSLPLVGEESTKPKLAAKKKVVAKKTAPEADLVQGILKLAEPKKKDVLYELGCGKVGVAVIAAKDPGSRGVAVDASASAIEAGKTKAKELGVEKRVTFYQKDVATLLKEGRPALTAATIVVVSDPGAVDEKLAKAIHEKLAPETRLVSVDYQFEGWKPRKQLPVAGEDGNHTLYLYTVPADRSAQSLAPFVPTPMEVVHEMLKLAQVTKDDVVYDLGCGDGRIVVEAAKLHGARGVGVDYDPQRCDEARERAEKDGVSDRVEIRREDVMKTDFSEATVITLYLLPSSNNLLRPKLIKMKPGTRIVSHDFDIDDWEALETKTVEVNGVSHTLYLWKVGEGPEPK